MKNLLFAIATILLFSSCGGSDSFTTASGTTVTYIEKGEGETPADSLVSMFNIKYTTENGKVLMDSDDPMPLKVDPAKAKEQGELFEILTMLKTGDSVVFELVAQELFEKTFRAPRPDSIAAESKIKFEIAYVEQLTEQGYFDKMNQRAEKAAAEQIIIDNDILDQYMEANSIAAAKTESGLRYVITEEGSGAKPESGQTVKVNYAGRILDGDYFDTSLESVAKEQGLYNEQRPYEPFQFVLGQGRVIKGWDEGIALLNEGSKATFYIPSPLGYGARGSGPIIQPNSILVFDVELVEIVE